MMYNTWKTCYTLNNYTHYTTNYYAWYPDKMPEKVHRQDSRKQEMTKFHRIRDKDVIRSVITGAIFCYKV